jgi:alpha-2-macroglobulin
MKNLIYCVLVLSISLFYSCSDKGSVVSDPDMFKDHIISYTNGLVSTESDIRTVLAFDNADWVPNQELTTDLFSISPKVPGKVVAINSNTIAFVPSKKLDQDTEYLVTLHLDELKDLPKEQRKFLFKVKTLKQNFAISFLDLQSYSKDHQYLNMDFQSADRITSAEAKQLISAKQGNKNLKIKFKESSIAQNNFEFYIDSIQRFADDSEVQIFWNGDVLGIDQKGEVSFPIPGKNNFSVVQADISETENAILVNFSDPVKPSQNFSGLVQLQDATNLKYSTAGNILKVYYPDNINGDKKLEVFQGIVSQENIKLKQNYITTITIGSDKPEIQFIRSGTILPTSNDLKINFKSINLNAVDVMVYKVYNNNILQFLQDNDYNSDRNLKRVGAPVARQTIYLNPNKLKKMNRWNVYAIDLSKLINPDPGAIYSVELSYKKSYAALDCITEAMEGVETLSDSDGEVRSTSEYDYDYDYDYDYYYDWEQRDNPCDESYYYRKSIKTNILASDVGVVVKRGSNGSYLFAVSNIVSAIPISGAEVRVYDYQQQLLANVVTDGDGFAKIDINKYGYFAVVTVGNNTTYVKLDEAKTLSLSNFDVQGTEYQNGLKGFVYTERGVWRPGDTIYVGFILNDLDAKLQKSHPITLNIKDAQGKSKYKATRQFTPANQYLFKVPTLITDPTGNWEARINVGGANFYKSLKVETIKPNRLKVSNSLADKEIEKSNAVTIKAKWLHGATAQNLKAEVQAKILPGKTEFKGFEKFNFDDKVRSFYPEETSVFSGRLNDLGDATFNFSPNISSQAPGKLKVVFQTRIFENGGDFSTDVSSSIYSPYNTYVGIKAPEPNKYGMLDTGKENIYEVKTLTAKGAPKANVNLQVEIYKINWGWWWNSYDGELTQYNYSDATTAYKSLSIKTNASGIATFKFNVPDQDWGRYLIRVIDENGGHATSITSLIDWPIWSGKTKNNGSSTANMLLFSADKEKYKVGETAKISFPSSVGARALVSLESGSQVIDARWVDTKEGETIVDIPLTDKMAPNVYVYVTLIRPHQQTISNAPIRMYGVLNLDVVNENTKLYPEIEIPKVLKPNETVTLKVREKNGKPMTYTIAIVDEGLLDLTRFKTPNAWNKFNARMALGVKTWDIYDQVIGAYGGKLNQVFSIGGDEALGAGEAKKANRFEPMVRVIGPFTLGKNSSEKHTIKIPNYIGSVRTMVVASNNETNSYGSTEVTTPVRQPLMVLASLPRKISPNERVTMPVTVFALEDNVRNVDIQVKTSGKTQVVGGSNKSLSFNGTGEKMAFFDLEVNDLEGTETIEVIASSGSFKATYKVQIDITNPNPLTTTYTDVVINPGKSQNIDFEAFGVKGSNQAILEVSSFPSINFNGRLNFLIQYPHGCGEQITSIAFPQLFMADIFELDPSQKSSSQRNVNATINLLNNYQVSSGGFAYWPGSTYVDSWVTSYIGQFMIEAETKGYILPDGMKNKWLDYQKREAKQWKYEKSNYNDISQAYRLYTLALAGAPDLASMNRLREAPNISDEARVRLAAAYALVKQDKVAKTLLQNVNRKNLNQNYYYGSYDRNQAILLETYVLLNDKEKGFEIANDLAKELSSDKYMSTQTTAYSLNSLSKFIKTVGAKGLNVSYNFADKSDKFKIDKAFADKKFKVSKGNHSIEVTNNGDNVVYVRIITSGILPVGDEQVIEDNLRISTTYKNRAGGDISWNSIKQGTEIIATVTVENFGRKSLKNVALQQIFPSGFEIVNLRFTDYGESFKNNADYIDIRDDRAMYYFDLASGERKTFTTVIIASYLGKYYLPGAYVEAMYDNTYKARNPGGWIEIVSD